MKETRFELIIGWTNRVIPESRGKDSPLYFASLEEAVEAAHDRVKQIDIIPPRPSFDNCYLKDLRTNRVSCRPWCLSLVKKDLFLSDLN